MIENVSVAEVLSQAAQRWPRRTALTFGNFEWTYEGAQERCVQAAARLSELGVRPADQVVLWAANMPEWIFLQFGLARLGAVLVTANTALGPLDLAYLLRDSKARFLIAGAEAKGHDMLAVLNKLERDALPHLEKIVLLEGGKLPDSVAYSELGACGGPAAAHPVGLDDLINMQYTSGTTGFPKGVMLSSRNIVNNAARTAQHLGLTPEDGVLGQVPLFHCFGCVIAVLATFTHGACLHLTRVFDPADSLTSVDRRRVSVIHGVPTMFQAMLEHPHAAELDLSSLRTGVMAGAACPASLVSRLLAEWGIPELTIGYGLTEASPAVTFTDRDAPESERLETVGRPLPAAETVLVDLETGAEGERGELWVRGEQVMLGYYDKPDATREVITKDGWLRTGDLAERDPNGCLRIVGRAKEMIIRGGENVYPVEVEEALRAHPDVSQVAVFGVPDERLGEQVVCAIVLRPEASLEPRELLDFLGSRISKLKVPARVEFLEELPMTASGKVKRFLLSERFGNS